MKYMLDTNICVYIIRRKPAAIIVRLRSLDISDVCLSSVTVAELEFGVAKSQRPEQNQWALTVFLAPLEILPFDEAAARRHGTLRHELEKSGRPIGSMDMLIAAHSLAAGTALVTNNADEFRRVRSLPVEYWK